MSKDNFHDGHNQSDTVHEGKFKQKIRTFRIRFAEGDLNFKPLEISDPVPLGRQLLQAAGVKAEARYSLFCILQSGDFENIRLNESIDLREKGADRFVAFCTDRTFKFSLDCAQIEWGKHLLNGEALYQLANLSNDKAVFLEARGGTDRLIKPDDVIDLRESGIEHFITAPKAEPTFEIIVNSRPNVVSNRKISFEELVQLAFPGHHDANVIFTMTFRHAASKPHAGQLGKGGIVEVKPRGTVINVARTVQS